MIDDLHIINFRLTETGKTDYESAYKIDVPRILAQLSNSQETILELRKALMLHRPYHSDDCYSRVISPKMYDDNRYAMEQAECDCGAAQAEKAKLQALKEK